MSVKSAFKLRMHPHPRFNPLTRVWVLVSPHRTQRPWQGQVESVSRESALPFDPNCYLCPGNARAGGARNPQYPETFVFDNDFATLRPDTQPGEIHENDMLVAQSETGRCRVVCFSPRHDLALARLSVDDIKRVVDVWAAEYTALGSLPTVSLVQIFENRGVMMSCSNPHPHGQIWVSDILPDEPVRELSSFVDYFQKHHTTLLEDYLSLELEKRKRIVCANGHFVAVVPFWAIWPFEIMVLSRRRVGPLPELRAAERMALADLLRQVAVSIQPSVLLHNGFSSKTDRRTKASGISSAWAFLSALATIGNGEEIHGGLRTVGDAAAGHHDRNGGGLFAGNF